MSLATKFGISQSLLDVVQASLDESTAYQAKVKAHMAKKGIKSLDDMSSEQKKSFFNELDAMHKAKNEEVDVAEAKADPTGSWVVYNNTDTAKFKRFKTREGAKAYAGKNGGTVASSEHYYDKIQKKDVAEAESHQSKTTMKHIDKPNAAEKNAAKDIKPGIKGVRDRLAMLQAAKDRGALKEEEAELTQEDLDFLASLNEMQIDELSKSTLGSYAKKAASSATKNAYEYGTDSSKKATAKNPETAKKFDTVNKRQKGIRKAVDRLTKEDLDLEEFTVEEIEEFMQTEDFDQLDELSKSTLGSYIKKRSHDVASQGAITRHHAEKTARFKANPELGDQRKSQRQTDKAFEKGWKHRVNIGKAVDRLTKNPSSSSDIT